MSKIRRIYVGVVVALILFAIPMLLLLLLFAPPAVFTEMGDSGLDFNWFPTISIVLVAVVIGGIVNFLKLNPKSSFLFIGTFSLILLAPLFFVTWLSSATQYGQRNSFFLPYLLLVSLFLGIVGSYVSYGCRKFGDKIGFGK